MRHSSKFFLILALIILGFLMWAFTVRPAQAQTLTRLDSARDAQQEITQVPSRAGITQTFDFTVAASPTAVAIPDDAKVVAYSGTGNYYRCIDNSCTVPRPTGRVTNGKGWMPNWARDYITPISGSLPTVLYIEGVSGSTVGVTFWK